MAINHFGTLNKTWPIRILFGESYCCNTLGIFEIVEQVIRYNLVWVSLRLINRESGLWKAYWPKPGYASITCSTISNIPYNLIFTTKFNDSSILITINSCDYLNLSLAD
jgi:hypothetical protein